MRKSESHNFLNALGVDGGGDVFHGSGGVLICRER